MKTPDWDFWLKMKVKPWQGCALSLGLNPDEMELRQQGDSIRIEPKNFNYSLSTQLNEELHKRLRLIEQNLSKFIPHKFAAYNQYIQIDIQAFANGASALGMALPNEMKDLVKDGSHKLAPFWAVLRTKEPNWNKWGFMLDAELWQAVALSLNIDPKKFIYDYEEGWIFNESDLSNCKLTLDDEDQLRQVVQELFKERFDIATSHLGSGSISLVKFSEWVESRKIPWKLPERFPRQTKSKNNGLENIKTQLFNTEKQLKEAQQQIELLKCKLADKARWPWGNHETESLNRLADAGMRFWKNYDPDDITTASNNDEIQKWLEEKGESRRTAQVMATILRADGLRTGPK